MTTGEKIIDALQSFKLKRTKDGEFRANSPLRPGSNSHAFSLKIEADGEHGAYHDHVSGESGSLYNLAQSLNIPLPERQKVEDTKRAYTGISDYAKAHGLDATQLQKWGWQECQRNGRAALSFDTRGGQRWRFLDGKKPYYISQAGYRRCWYGLSKHLSRLLSYSLVICNGEMSVIAAQSAGIPAIAMTGGENEFPDDLIDELKVMRPSEILLAFDCDGTGRRVAAANKERLAEAGFTVRALDLGLSDKGDLADFVMLHGDASLVELFKRPDLKVDNPVASTPRMSRRWEIIPAKALKDLPAQQWLIPGIIPDKSLTAIYGRTGEGKSFYALGLALRVAQSRPVIYMAAEGQAGYLKRVAAWCEHYKQGVGQLFFCMGAVRLLDEKDRSEFIDTVCAYHPAMIMIDTVARTLVGGDENSSRDMSMYIDACDQMINRAQCATVLIHHIGKAGYTARGSTVLPGACDMMIALSSEDDIIRVECTKSKDEAPFEPQFMRMVQIDTPYGQSVVMLPSNQVAVPKTGGLSNSQLLVLRCLSKTIYEEGATTPDIEEDARLSRSAVVNAINRLMDRQMVERVQRGIYAIRESGKDELDRVDRVDRALSQPDPKNILESENTSRSTRSNDQPELFTDGKRVAYD